MADYSAYGPWVGGDDWRAWVGVYITTNNETTLAGRIESWVWSEYGTTSGYSNIKGAAAWDNNAWSYGSATSISTNSWKKLKEVTFSVAKGHSATSKTAWAKAEGISGTYSGSSSQATVSVSVPAKKSYAVSYNANGHGTAPSGQTKWHGETLQLRGAISATGYTFKGWNTKADGSGTSYAASANYTGNAALTLYAQWQAITYAVTYNANGGSGAPATGYKTYGANYTISTTRPQRTGYTFLGWGTSASATTASYQPGATYSTNAALALYAVWQLSYAAPTITGLNAKRCDSQGVDDDEGTYALLSFHWAVDPSDGGEISTITVRTRPKGGDWSTGTISAGGTTSGDVAAVLGDGTTFATSTAYDIQVEVLDQRGMKATSTTYLSPSFFTLDFLAGGTGIAIGKAATRDGLDVAMPAYFSDELEATAGVHAQWLSINHNTATIASDGYARVGHLDVGDAITYGGSKQYKEVLDSTGKSLANNTWTSLGSVSLAAGVWVVVFTAQFTANATGRRGINLASTAGSSSTNAQAAMQVPAASGAQTVVSRANILNVTSTTTYHINAYQNSGSALTTYSDIRAARIA